MYGDRRCNGILPSRMWKVPQSGLFAQMWQKGCGELDRNIPLSLTDNEFQICPCLPYFVQPIKALVENTICKNLKAADFDDSEIYSPYVEYLNLAQDSIALQAVRVRLDHYFVASCTDKRFAMTGRYLQVADPAAQRPCDTVF